MEAKNNYKNLLVILFIVLIIGFAESTYAQIAIATYSETPINSGSTDVKHTNNDFREWTASSVDYTMKVIVWDGTYPGLGWDDGHSTGSVLLGHGISGVVPFNPDVSLSSDGRWAIVVYEDLGNSNSIVAETYQWNNGYNLYNTTVLFKSGASPKIDNNDNDYFAIVWMKDSPQYGAIYSCVVDLSGSGNSPNYYNEVVLQDAGSNNLSFYDPDVTVNADNVYYTFISDDGTDNTVNVEIQGWGAVESGSLSTGSSIYELQYSSSLYVYSKPRISSNRISNWLSYMDWAVVAEAVNSNNNPSTQEIHGFIKWMSNLPTVPYVYNNGSLQGSSSYDMSMIPNYEPVVSYIADYLYFLWTVDNSSNTLAGNLALIDQQDVIAIRTQWDGYIYGTNYYPSDYYVANYCTRNNDFAPSVSGRFAINSNDFLAAFCCEYVNSCNHAYDVYYKTENYYSVDPFKTEKSPNVASSFTIFPNPFDDFLIVELPYAYQDNDNICTISITDIMGRTIFEDFAINQKNLFLGTCPNLTNGIYFMKILDKNHEIVFSSKLSKL
ncbi:MAG: T9SS type A sorting domain-containing protein [Bacteroidetes bacterium]|nr:T9SS type A sorting domain-containing protein [Bacteroidota bacterium]